MALGRSRSVCEPEFEALRKSKAFARLARLVHETSGLTLRAVPPGTRVNDPLPENGATRVCSQLRQRSNGEANCKKTLGTLLRLAASKWGVHCTKCAVGFHEGAVPVVVDGLHVATLVIGGARGGDLDGKTHSKQLQKVIGGFSKTELTELSTACLETPAMPDKKFRCLVELLAMYAGELGKRALQEARNAARKEPQAVRAAKEFLENNLSLHSLTEAAAAHIGVCHTHLNRLFKASAGMTLMQYVLRRRVARAMELLAGDGKMIEIAADAGFQTVGEFNRVFKRQTGTTPSDFRARMSEGVF